MTLRLVVLLCLTAFAVSLRAGEMPATSPATQPVAAAAQPSVAYFDLGRPITEKPSDYAFLFAEQGSTLRSLLQRLEKAREDGQIKAVLLTLGGTSLNLSQALELRDALQALHKAGKRSFVYADAYDADTYIMASGASDVCLLGGGEIEMPGVGLETLFAKGMLDKIGVEADFEQIGEYKGADEAYIHTRPSAEMSGELNRLVDGLYSQLIDNIARNRNLAPEKVRQIVDEALIPGERAKELGLVDHLVDADGLRDLMKEELGQQVVLLRNYGDADNLPVDLSNPFAFFSLLSRRPQESDRQAVALIYAEGVIVDGATAQSLFGGSDEVGSEDLRTALRIAARDDQIKAVVLRIDSPGGSALASEAMWQAVRRVAKSKPVVVSIGSMAASGGYYLATSANTIYADPTAIVGSIGVVGGKFVMKDLYAKLGLSTATFERGANAGLFTSDEPWTDQQRKMVHAWMQETYVQFTQRVMTTRKGKIADIDKVARGRIFLAEQARSLGMVDDIGGLTDAINEAARQGKMAPDSYDVRVVPAPRTLADLFADNASTKLNLQPAALSGESLLGILPASERGVLEEQISMLHVLQAHPVAVVFPYAIRSR